MPAASLQKPAAQAAGFFVSGSGARSACGAAGPAPDQTLANAFAGIAARAGALDAAPAFPAHDIEALHAVGLLHAPAPIAYGGQGWGTSATGALPLLSVLRAMGAASLPVGRLYEAHVNVLALVAAYGSPGQNRRAAEDAASGALFGLWVTDGAAPLRLKGGVLRGGKAVCSGAGHIRRALVTALRPDGGVQMALTAPPAEGAAPAGIRLTGMRASVTGPMELSGLTADPVGQPGDYLREPVFSAGAWRGAALILGGLDELVRLTGSELVARGRAGNPHQRARFGRLLSLRETASLWMSRAAILAEARDAPHGTVVGYVNLARLAVESACLEAIEITQRALGLNAFIEGRPVERLMRDLATYLRQPAADEAMCEAAAWFMDEPWPV